MNVKRIFSYLRTLDVVTIIFTTSLSVVNIVFSSRIPSWRILVLVNTVFTIVLVFIAYRAETGKNRVLSFIHDWYIVPIIFFGFKEVYFMGYPIHGKDYDDLLIALDYALLGVNPTEWLMQFAHPLLTEVLQISYFFYYFILLSVAYELFRRGNSNGFQYTVFLFAYSFYLSYMGYFVFPAVGPRFVLHDFHTLDSELPGLFLTKIMRTIINAGESIPPGAQSALELAQRDVFPSGHTMLTLVAIILSFRYRLSVRWANLVLGVLLIVSTVYLRYHYVVDILAGFLWWAVCLWTAPKIHSWWTVKQENFRLSEVPISSA